MAATLARAGAATLSDARSKTAGRKQELMIRLRDSLAGQDADPELVAALDGAIAAFDRARSEHRNVLSHIYGFTVGRDDDGAYLPGVAHVTSDGRDLTVAETPAQLLTIAHEIEEAIDPLDAAREAVAAAFPRP